jgi:hypothetical protein
MSYSIKAAKVIPALFWVYICNTVEYPFRNALIYHYLINPLGNIKNTNSINTIFYNKFIIGKVNIKMTLEIRLLK